MKIIEVPVFNEDGSLSFTAMVSPEEAQRYLQFAINFQIALASTIPVAVGAPGDNNDNPEFDD